jgi:hypothetical protein
MGGIVMAWVAVHKNGDEVIFDFEPYRWNDSFWVEDIADDIYLPKGTIKKLIGRDLTWSDEPVELKEE